MPEIIRIVADTNVIISGLFWFGPPREILDAARDEKIQLYTSVPLLTELDDVLRREKLSKRLAAATLTADELVLGFAALAQIVTPQKTVDVIVDDPEDNIVLECALEINADYIVSGDNHLLSLGKYKNIPILKVDELLIKIQK